MPMDFPELDPIYPQLAERLDHARYYHSLGVMQVAVAMALEHGLDPGRAALAGLLHDCERCETVEGLRAKIERFKIEIPPEAEILLDYAAAKPPPDDKPVGWWEALPGSVSWLDLLWLPLGFYVAFKITTDRR